ncbi:hypothetical protein N9J37_01610 [Pontimonas sp.]|nr:hypothetical protein [Pontimonas sp.]MDA9116991.1 hypothetical protein [Pontimonas sp.]
MNQTFFATVKHIARHVLWRNVRHALGGFPTLSETTGATLRYFLNRLRRSKDSQHRLSFESLFSNNRVWVINLDYRRDRLQETYEVFARAKFGQPQRFSAIEDKNGYLGCSLSHQALLEQAQNQFPMLPVAIFEDDIEFLLAGQDLERLVTQFLSNPAADVLVFGYNTKSFMPQVSRVLRVVTASLTTSGYLVKGHAIPKVLEAAKTSVEMFSKGAPPSEASIDVVWQILQAKELVFVTGKSRPAKQRESYSDISQKVAKRKV